MNIDLSIFNLENQSNEPFNQTSEVSALNENFENKTINLNHEYKKEYEQMFQGIPNEIENSLSLKPFVVDSKNKSISMIEQPPRLEINRLPSHIKYAYFSENETFLVIISNDLSLDQEASLLSILSENKKLIGWSIADIKGISSALVQYRIHLINEAKPTRDAQRSLNPKVKDVVREEILKLLDNGI